jgi:hypothetical protein
MLIALSNPKLDNLEVMKEHSNAKADHQDSTLGIYLHRGAAVWHRFEPLDEIVKPINAGMKTPRQVFLLVGP